MTGYGTSQPHQLENNGKCVALYRMFLKNLAQNLDLKVKLKCKFNVQLTLKFDFIAINIEFERFDNMACV